MKTYTGATSYKENNQTDLAEKPECSRYDPEKWAVTGRRRNRDQFPALTEDNVEAIWICNRQCPLLNECLTRTVNLPKHLRPADMIQGGLYWDSNTKPRLTPVKKPHRIITSNDRVPGRII